MHAPPAHPHIVTATLLLHWAVTLAPVLLLLVVFEWLDVFHLMGGRELALVLLLGAAAGLSAYPVSGRVLDALPMGFSTYSRFAAPWIEEALKGAAIVLLFARNRIGFKLDAAISGFAVGAGFSIVENVFYLVRFPQLDIGIWIVRGLGTALMHGATGALFATLAHQMNERDARQPGVRWRWHPLHYLPGYLVAVALHTLFNQFPDQPQIAMLTTLVAVPLLVMLIFRVGEREADAWLDSEAASHRDTLAELRAGDFPDTASGRLVAGLAERLSGRVPGETIRDYLEVHTAIVLRAEEVLRHDAAHAAAPPGDADRALFVRLRDLQAALGRTTLAVLRPLLPFSANELWEMRELELKLAHAARPSPADAHGRLT